MREPLKDKNRLEHIINAIDIILMGTPIIHNPTHTKQRRARQPSAVYFLTKHLDFRIFFSNFAREIK